MIDRERLFHMLASKDWQHLFEQLYLQRKELQRDPILQQLEQFCTTEFVAHLQTLPCDQQVLVTRHVGMLVMSDRHFFRPQFWKPVMTLRLQALFDVRDPAFSGLASEFSADLPLATSLLEQLHQQRPEELADARRSALNIKAVAPTAKKEPPRHVSCLFRSPQERAFFQAAGKTYPQMLAYPNVALSAAISYEPIKASLSLAAREFFFRGQFDCVLFDRETYLPRHFFELDSSFHNATEAKARDALKDEICRAAGVKLLRIRGFEAQAVTLEAFEQLIVELIGSDERKTAAVQRNATN